MTLSHSHKNTMMDIPVYGRNVSCAKKCCYYKKYLKKRWSQGNAQCENEPSWFFFVRLYTLNIKNFYITFLILHLIWSNPAWTSPTDSNEPNALLCFGELTLLRLLLTRIQKNRTFGCHPASAVESWWCRCLQRNRWWITGGKRKKTCMSVN